MKLFVSPGFILIYIRGLGEQVISRTRVNMADRRLDNWTGVICVEVICMKIVSG